MSENLTGRSVIITGGAWVREKHCSYVAAGHVALIVEPAARDNEYWIKWPGCDCTSRCGIVGSGEFELSHPYKEGDLILVKPVHAHKWSCPEHVQSITRQVPAKIVRASITYLSVSWSGCTCIPHMRQPYCGDVLVDDVIAHTSHPQSKDPNFGHEDERFILLIEDG